MEDSCDENTLSPPWNPTISPFSTLFSDPASQVLGDERPSLRSIFRNEINNLVVFLFRPRPFNDFGVQNFLPTMLTLLKRKMLREWFRWDLLKSNVIVYTVKKMSFPKILDSMQQKSHVPYLISTITESGCHGRPLALLLGLSDRFWKQKASPCHPNISYWIGKCDARYRCK